jgi:hypothetical protein
MSSLYVACVATYIDKKVVGKINSGPLALMLLAAVAKVATELRATLKDRIDGQKVMEIDKNAEDGDVDKFVSYLTGDKGFRYTVEFEAKIPLMYVNREFLEAFNVPNCCEIKIL